MATKIIRPKDLEHTIMHIAQRHPGEVLNTDRLWELLCLEEPQQAELVRQQLQLYDRASLRSHRWFMAKALGSVNNNQPSAFHVWTDRDGRKIRLI